MLPSRLPKLRFSLKSVFVLILGITIGFALNLRKLQLLTGLAPNEAYMTSLPPYTIEPPDVLTIGHSGNLPAACPSISGQHLVGPDGRVNLGTYGSVYVSGSTLEEAKKAVEKQLSKYLDDPQVVIDIFAYNSKVYYIVTQGQGTGDSIVRVPITGHETVLDAIAHIGGLKASDSTQLWIARPPLHGVGSEKILPIEWDNIARDGSAITNYQSLPGDRLIVSQKSMSAAPN
jgi:protein involved in polysaccharide export with SLBB domain